MYKIVSNVVVALTSNVFMLVSIRLLNAKWSMRFQRFQEHHKHTKAHYIYVPTTTTHTKCRLPQCQGRRFLFIVATIST